ncbi:hypothetical protein ACYOEI_16505 [Singulisphaera rosea]
MKSESLWEECQRCGGSGREAPVIPWDEIEPTPCFECEGRKGKLTTLGSDIDDLLRVIARSYPEV